MYAYNPMRLNIGSIGYCKPDIGNGAVSPDYVVFGCDPKQLDSKFLYYVTKSRYWADWVADAGVGSVRVRIYYKELAKFPCPLPPLEEQRAIAGVLGSLDDKIEQNRRTAGKLEELARAVFRAWFVDFAPVHAKANGATSYPGLPQAAFNALPTTFTPATNSPLGPIPEGWTCESLTNLADIIGGGTPKRSEPKFWGEGIPWYSVKDAPDEGQAWVISTDETITQEGLDGSSARLLSTGATIISARGTVGRLAIAGVPMAFNQSCYGLIPTDKSSPFVLYQAMRQTVAELRQRTHGSVFDTITSKTFERVELAWPPKPLVDAFEEVLAPLYELMKQLLGESQKLAELRDYLLPRLLSGAVRVKQGETKTGDSH